MRKLTEMLSTHESWQRPPAVAATAAASCQMSAETDAQLLRTLATLCCVEDCLIQLQEVALLHSISNALKFFAVDVCRVPKMYTQHF